MRVNIGRAFLFLSAFFIFVSCGDLSSRVDSINLDSCFLNWDNPAELEEELKQASEKPHEPAFMVVRGCLSYQSGHYSVAEEWLKRAFQESQEDAEEKALAASALSLIYLKERQKDKIKAYTQYVSQHSIGRWMLILYHIDNYRETGQSQHLQKAIAQVQFKHNAEVPTSATIRLLQHMLTIKEMEDLCGINGTADDSSKKATSNLASSTNQEEKPASAPSSTACANVDLEDEKQYLFSTAYGFLSMLVKAPPFNSFRLKPQKEVDTEEETQEAL